MAWRFTPLADYVAQERAQAVLSSVKENNFTPLWVITAYLIGGVVAFPVLILIVATVATFGPWLGFLYAIVGVLASALLMYSVGTLAGPALLKSIAGSRFAGLRQAVENRGVLAIAAIRLVPVAPFTVVNLIAGACSIRLIDYVAGTLIGMLPGLIAISALGQQITTLVTDFSAANVTLLLLLIALWAALAWAAQMLASRLRKRAS
jgi:phospholipase D1/2